MLMFTFDEIQAAGASLSRLVGVVTMPVEHRGDGPAAGDRGAGAEQCRLQLRRPQRGAAGRVDLRVEPGERVALVGSTGAGEDDAGLDRGRHPAAGQRERPGSAAYRWPSCRRATVAIVSQETHVFAGPLVEDLRLARPGARTSPRSRQRWPRSGALEWAHALPEGLDTVVGDGGHGI